MSRAVGIGRELKVVRLLREAGWAAWTAKNDGECRDGKYGQGPVDIIAMKPGHKPRVIQVKSTASSAFHSFGPVKREALLFEARKADAEAWLAWWPPGRGGCRWIHEGEWPLIDAVQRAA